jgi:hypothetical protein
MASPIHPSDRSASTVPAVDHAARALVAVGLGDQAAARAHIARAQRGARVALRRHRQIIEIATLVVAGSTSRAAGLALEHVTEFPDDAVVLGMVGPCDGSTGPAADMRSR